MSLTVIWTDLKTDQCDSTALGRPLQTLDYLHILTLIAEHLKATGWLTAELLWVCGCVEGLTDKTETIHFKQSSKQRRVLSKT